MQCHGSNVGPMGSLRQGNGNETGGVPFVAEPVCANEERTWSHAGNNPRPRNVVVAFDTTQVTSKGNYSSPKPGDPCHPIAAGAHPPAVAFQERGRPGGRTVETQEDMAYSLTAPDGGGRRHEMNIAAAMGVRRLTPTECERLQGFPDGWTAIEINGKPASDSARYRALGNSWAVPVVRWIGRRIMEAIA
jgi:DNA (cytosine-5)-methyltransferase 1